MAPNNTLTKASAYHSITEQELRDAAGTSRCSQAFQETEWKPISLRPISITVLALTLLLSLVALELVEAKIRKDNGLELGVATRAFRYVPTVVAIIIGFAWRATASDLSLITPWSSISNKWEMAASSISPNYSDSIDVVTVHEAIKNKHWSLALVTICGLLSGLLVPLTNTLSVPKYDASTNKTITVPMTSQFFFNTSLAPPVGWRLEQPIIDYKNARGDPVERSYTPFLSDHYAYESFDTTEAAKLDVVAFSTLNAFSSMLHCDDVDYITSFSNLGGNSSFVLETNVAEGCDIQQQIILPYNSSMMNGTIPQNTSSGMFDLGPTFWLNVTKCEGDQDYQLLVTALALDIPLNSSSTGNTSIWTNTSISTRSRGLICSPQYYIQSADVAINGSTGLIERGPFLNADIRNITDVGIGMDLIAAFLNDPLDSTSQSIFELAATNQWSSAVLPNSYNWTMFSSLQVMQRYAWIYLYKGAIANTINHTWPNGDLYFDGILSQNTTTAWSMFDDETMMANVVQDSFSVLLAELVNSVGRSSSLETMNIILGLEEIRTFTRIEVLRAIEVILIILTIVTLLVGTKLRPQTVLSENPASLRFIAELLATSSQTSQLLESSGHVSQFNFTSSLRDNMCRLVRSERGFLELQTTRAEKVEGSLRSLIGHDQRRDDASANNVYGVAAETTSQGLSKSRYQPFVLKLGVRLVVQFSLTLFVLAVCITLGISHFLGGFYTASAIDVAAWTFFPSICIVVLGYAVASLQHAALVLTTYTQLAANETRSHFAIIRRQAQDASTILLQHYAVDWTIIFLVCFVTLVTLPALKIVAGSLFFADTGYIVNHSKFTADISPLSSIDKVANVVISPVHYVPQFAESVMQQLSPRHRAFEYVDRIGNMNLPVITQNFSLLAPHLNQTSSKQDLMETRLAALQTDISCEALKPTDFALFAQDCDADQTITYYVNCSSALCSQKLGTPFSNANISVGIDSTRSFYPYVSTTWPSSSDDSLAVLVVDFSPLKEFNSQINNSDCSAFQPLDSDLIKANMPLISAVNCSRTVNLVSVNVTFALRNERSPTGSSGLQFDVAETVRLLSADEQYDWYPVSYDNNSVQIVSRAWTAPPPFLAPDAGTPLYHTGETIGTLLTPTYFINMISQYQEIQSGRAADLLEPQKLQAATQAIYQMYSPEAISLTIGGIHGQILPTIPSSAYAPADYQICPATFTSFRPVMKQSIGMTIAFLALALLLWICVAYIYSTTPRRTLLTKSPNSIASQMSLLAGSRLVDLIRERQSRGESTEDLFSSRYRFGLGWWPSNRRDLQDEANDRHADHGSRWGIDIGMLHHNDRNFKREKVSQRFSYIPARRSRIEWKRELLPKFSFEQLHGEYRMDDLHSNINHTSNEWTAT